MTDKFAKIKACYPQFNWDDAAYTDDMLYSYFDNGHLKGDVQVLFLDSLKLWSVELRCLGHLVRVVEPDPYAAFRYATKAMITIFSHKNMEESSETDHSFLDKKGHYEG